MTNRSLSTQLGIVPPAQVPARPGPWTRKALNPVREPRTLWRVGLWPMSPAGGAAPAPASQVRNGPIRPGRARSNSFGTGGVSMRQPLEGLVPSPPVLQVNVPYGSVTVYWVFAGRPASGP